MMYLCAKQFRLQRYFIRLAYNGTRYHGWQIQPNAVTVQEILTHAISLLLRREVEITGCGRTDTGVHASMFFAHFESEEILDAAACFKLSEKLNAFLSADISIATIFPVASDMHARFSAVSRSYEYRIARQKNPFLPEFSHYFSGPLDVEKMNSAAQLIMEYRDFSCFSKAHTQTKTNNCLITEARWEEEKEVLIFKISADRFLRNMVRAIVGTLIDVGLGKIDESDVRRIIQSGDRCMAGKSMPAAGLFLTKVEYPDSVFTYKRD
jgi:tRNA pseudouridine38-40 synthase